MTNEQQPAEGRLRFLIQVDDQGRIFLSSEASEELESTRFQIPRPVTRKRLEEARWIVMGRWLEQLQALQAEEESPPDSEQRRAALREVRAALHPWRHGSWLIRGFHVIEGALSVLLQLLVGLLVISLVYRGLQLSSEHLPLFLHLAVLVLYALGLAFGISLIVTEQNREESRRLIRVWFGPRGWLIFTALLLVTSAAVFASLSHILQGWGWLAFEACRGRTPSEPVLLDFYLWHFLKMVPFLKIPEVLRWEMPLCYSQSAIGFMILLFQGLVVIPSIATIRYFLKNRQDLEHQGYDYLLDETTRPVPDRETAQDRPAG